MNATQHASVRPGFRMRIGVVEVGSAVACGGLLVELLRHPQPSVWRLALVLVLQVFPSWTRASLGIGGRRVSTEGLGVAGTLVGLVLVPGGYVIAAVAFAQIFKPDTRDHQPWRKLFNVANHCGPAAVGALAFTAISSGHAQWATYVGLAVAGLLDSALNDLTVSWVIAAMSGERLRVVLEGDVGLQLLSTGLNLVLALGVTAELRAEHWEVLALLPVGLAFATRSHVKDVARRTETDALTRLEAASTAVSSLDEEHAVIEILDRAADLFAFERAELVLLDWPGVGTQTHLRAAGGAVVTEPAGPGPAPEPAADAVVVPLLSTLGTDSVLLGELRLTFALKGPLGTAEQQVLNTFAATVAASLAHTRSYVEQVRTARIDSLTGLPNRLALREQVELLEPAFLDSLAEADGRPPAPVAAVVLLDLDHFKEVNDTLGHEAGDRMLVVLAERLSQLVRDEDMVARLGGDEFAILLRGIRNRGHAAASANSLLERLNAPIAVDGLDIPVEASVGVALAPADAATIDGLLRCADVAMYAAKEKRNSVVLYDPAMDTASEERLHLLAELQNAVRRGELICHYQPLVDLKTAEVVGAEALVRWEHPERGMLLPGRFVPAVEQTALIVPLTLEVLNQAIADAVQWRQLTGRDLTISVNISPRCLMVRELPDRVMQILATHGLPARCLTLEITETLALADLEVVEDVLARLRAVGAQLSVDDFGTGFSSMSFLREIAVNEVKVDGGFVRAAPSSQEDSAIVFATIALAHGLGLPIVGEGVETDEQLALLLEAGADIGQGFLLARPLPAAEFPSVAMRRNQPVVQALQARSVTVDLEASHSDA